MYHHWPKNVNIKSLTGQKITTHETALLKLTLKSSFLSVNKRIDNPTYLQKLCRIYMHA